MVRDLPPHHVRWIGIPSLTSLPTDLGVTMHRRFRQLLVKRIAAERGIAVSDVHVVECETFPRNRWGDVGTITVNYAPGQQWRAMYGFDALARVNCYAD